VTVNKTNTPGLQAIVDYLAGVRTPLPLSTAGLSVVTGAANGTSLGSVTGKDVNSTLTLAGLYGSDGGNVAINGSTGQVTVANSAGLTVGTHNITVRDTNAGYTAPGYVDTNFTYSTSLAPPSDNFNDNSLNLTLWTNDNQLAGAHGTVSTGITALEQNQRFEFAGSTANQNYLRLASTVDLTQLPKHFVEVVGFSAGSAECYPMSFGNLGGAIIRPALRGGQMFLDWFNAAGTFNTLGSLNLAHADGNKYRLRLDMTVGTAAGATITSITHSGNVATVTTSAAHNIPTGDGGTVTVAGATPSDYNVANAAVTVLSSTTFSYTMATTPASNATVMGSYTWNCGTFYFDYAPATASNPPIETDWINAKNTVRSTIVGVGTTGYLGFGFKGSGSAGNAYFDGFNTAT
jgi:hypothetical protein